MAPFEIICEIEPAITPDLTRVRHQVGVLAPIATAFLIPDNHIGRATVSSIAVAREVAAMGGRAIACLNARDRNVLGFRRDLLTAAAYGVNDFLFVYGDRPETGRRSDDLTVRSMLTHARSFTAEHPGAGGPRRFGVATGPVAVPAWKADADMLFVQVGFSVDEILAWRRATPFTGRTYAAVMVIASPTMARKLTAEVPQLAVPDWLTRRLEGDRSAGVAHACDTLEQLRDSGLFDGVHLIPVGKYREVAARLERST